MYLRGQMASAFEINHVHRQKIPQFNNDVDILFVGLVPLLQTWYALNCGKSNRHKQGITGMSGYYS